MEAQQERQYFAEILPDGVLVFDDGGDEIAYIDKSEVFDENPWCPEEAWESLLQRIEQLYCVV